MYNVLICVCAIVMTGLPGSEKSSNPRKAGAAVRSPAPASMPQDPVLPDGSDAGGPANRATGFSRLFSDDDAEPVSRPLWQAGNGENPVIRGQSSDGMFTPPPSSAPLTMPFDPNDPFRIQAGPDPVLPYINDPGSPVLSGVNGPQPYRFGFTPIFDGTYIAPAHAKSPGQGNFSVQEYDAALKHVSMLGPDWIFTNTGQFGARIWNGPNYPDLPGSVYRFGWDFLLNTPQWGGWSAQLDFNPSINTDFTASLGRESLNLDAFGALVYRASPQLMYVMGVQYWDRVNNIIIPYGGAVWNPNERLEMRLLFPKSRISYFLGTVGDGSHWLYATGEYHVESYQITVPGVSGRDQIQLSDWRVGVGLRSDHQWYDKYLEVGYVFSRHNIFLNSVPDFSINGGLMARFGVRF